jgi:signal transduction histidine kinase
MRTDRGWRRFYATGWLVSAGITAVAFRQWQAYVREVEERAEEAERTREEMARRRGVEERLRIARDLHDSLTHSISVIRLQAGVAVHLARKHGHDVPEALLAIQEASVDAIHELRSTLDTLRRDDEPNGHGLDRVGFLVERAEASGVSTHLEVRGSARELPPEVDRTAYRIVQEGLTNVGRHAGDATADIRVTYGPDFLTIEVEDDGRKLNEAPVPGLGLVGMRERVTALGGSLCTGPRPDRGFAVRAQLPTPDAS